MEKYPRISTRLDMATKLRLQALAAEKSKELGRRVTPSDLVQACIGCIIGNPQCIARSKVLKSQRKDL